MAKKKGPEVHCSHDRMVKLEDLKPNPANPNRHPGEQVELLARLIADTGWRAPITVSKRSGFIVRGHGRYEAAQLAGCDEAPVDFQDYESEAAELADLVADNRLAELSETDYLALKDLLEQVDTGEIDLWLTGYTEAEIERMMTAVWQPTDDDDDPDEDLDYLFDKPLEPESLRVFSVALTEDEQATVARAKRVVLKHEEFEGSDQNLAFLMAVCRLAMEQWGEADDGQDGA